MPWRPLWVGLVLLVGLHSQTLGDTARPNFLVLLCDDLRWDCLGCTGHSLLRTPHIDRMAAHGVLFENAFVTTSICCISRASYLTGQYARRHAIADFNTPLSPEVLAETYPAVLKRAGYRTGCFGKWGLGGTEPRELFDVWDAWGGQGEYFHKVNGESVHNSEYLAQKTEQFLRSQPAGDPFCLLVYYKSPHDPLQPDPRDAELFREDRIEPPKTATPDAFERLPEFIRQSEGRLRAQKAHPDAASYQEFVKQYLRLVAGVDRSVGRIQSLLDELGLADQTVVVFSSDNGFFLGERGLSHKWLMHEESIRVPLIIHDPRLAATHRGRKRTELVLNLDVAPTLLDLAGAPIPLRMDGRSLKPLLQGESPNWRSDFFYEHHFHYGGKIPRTEGVRSRDWKYITYFDVSPGFEELYDLARDPQETRNLALIPEYREKLDELKRRHREFTKTLGPAVLPKN
ncbi:MAG: sulfatase [Planctomycetales bacterium]